MKQLKYILMMALVAFTAVSCLTGKGFDEDKQGPVVQNKLSLTANKSVIYANGNDFVQLEVSFSGQSLSAEEFELYYTDSNLPVELDENMRFTTDTAGQYDLYATYTSDEGEDFRSNNFSITAILEVNLDDLEDSTPTKNDISLNTSTLVYQAESDRVIFVVRYNGIVVRDPEVEQNFGGERMTISYKICDYETMDPIEGLEVMDEVRDGEHYKLYYYSAKKAETRTFFVLFNALNSYASPVTVKAVDVPVPPRANDPQPENYDFKHRAMIMQFTGLGCTYCPLMIAALDDILHEEGYSEEAVLAVSHTYSNDPFAPEENLGAMVSGGYPYVNIDFAVGFSNYGYAENKVLLKSNIDNRVSRPAQAGISANMSLDGNSLIVRMTIKAAETNYYRVGAWLLEDGLYGKQTNGTMPDDGTYDFDTHNNVVRKAHSVNPKGGFTGHDLDQFAPIQAGTLADYLFDFTIDSSWKKENCHLVLFVTALTSNGGYVVTNAVNTNSLVEAVEFEYN